MPTSRTAKLQSAKRIARQKLAARRFRDRNRRFNKLSVEKQRIKIIQDVVTHLESEKLKAVKGKYLRVLGVGKVAGNQQLHEVMGESRCQVCGIGAVFTATVLLNNELKVGDLSEGYREELGSAKITLGDGTNDAPMRQYLSTWFCGSQLDLIEAAFETDDRFSDGYANYEELEDAASFGKKYRNSKDRLIAICKNILENKGTFTPVTTKSDSDAE